MRNGWAILPSRREYRSHDARLATLLANNREGGVQLWANELVTAFARSREASSAVLDVNRRTVSRFLIDVAAVSQASFRVDFVPSFMPDLPGPSRVMRLIIKPFGA